MLYCTNHENERILVLNSYACYAIRKIFDAVVGENEVEPSPLDLDRTMTFGDIDIKSEQMDAILNHQYTPEEEAWELPSPYPGYIEAFLTGRRMSKALEGERKAKDVKEKVEREPPKPKIDRTGLITVQTICDEIKMDPRDARAALRKAKVEKPSTGWSGDAKWAADIKTMLVKAKTELDKKGK